MLLLLKVLEYKRVMITKMTTIMTFQSSCAFCDADNVDQDYDSMLLPGLYLGDDDNIPWNYEIVDNKNNH